MSVQRRNPSLVRTLNSFHAYINYIQAVDMHQVIEFVKVFNQRNTKRAREIDTFETPQFGRLWGVGVPARNHV